MALVRVVRTAASMLSKSFSVDEVATDATGSVTVSVARPDGTVLTSGTASDAAGVGNYTFVLPGGPASPASVTWQLDLLTVTWSGTFGGVVVSVTDQVEIVGGFYFGLPEARASDTSLTSVLTYPMAALAAKRVEVEQECDRVTGRAFVPRFRRIRLNGSGRYELATPDVDLRTVRTVSMAWMTGQALTAVTGTALTNIVPTPDGLLVNPIGWPRGSGNVLVEYEYGLDRPPSALADKAMAHLRVMLNANRSGVPDRAYTYTTNDGGAVATYQLAVPKRGSVGVPEIDAVYARYEAASRGFA